MTEWIMAVDINRNKLGVKSREAIHLDGDWHETFQCWFIELVNSEYYIHLQLRSAMKKDFPSLYDITAAGHLMEGESVQDGVREIKEELGITISYHELYFLGAIHNTIRLPHFIDNEISLVYLYEIKSKIHYQFLDKEVESVIRIKLKDFKQLIEKNVDAVDYEQYVRDEFVLSTNRISTSNIVPHELKYYRLVITNIESYIQKL